MHNVRVHLPPETNVHFVAPDGTQVGPEPFSTVCQRVDGGQIPADTLVWWPESPEWVAFRSLRDGAPPSTASVDAQASTDAQPVAASVGQSPGAGDNLMSGFSDDELDEQFLALVKRSWDLFKEAEHATSIDEAMLSGIVTAFADCGYVLIDITTAGSSTVVAQPQAQTSGPSAHVAVDPAAIAAGHSLRFEEPGAGHRITVQIEHTTADVATAKLLGHLATAVIGYGERVGNFGQVGQAIRQEVASSFVASPEPGTISWDADLSSGYVYANIDLILELDTYVDDSLHVDHEILRKHLAAVINTLRTFVRARFGQQ